MDELELEAIVAEAETSTNIAWLRRTLVEVAGELRKRVVRDWKQSADANPEPSQPDDGATNPPTVY